ncbi:unnamed protein product [Parascedosporium putredinis]|uniref:Uncharacterized protein n=1 Tax=Parascedosporium putredinis TaxID=1442378 RepID=A0A9P1H8U9_9PEZI|nr:unnamed protein product [Parascedosporium putredinis]CAI8001249.1 unnamed protein product [Parascedosporium putredinis]
MAAAAPVGKQVQWAANLCKIRVYPLHLPPGKVLKRVPPQSRTARRLAVGTPAAAGPQGAPLVAAPGLDMATGPGARSSPVGSWEEQGRWIAAGPYPGYAWGGACRQRELFAIPGQRKRSAFGSAGVIGTVLAAAVSLLEARIREGAAGKNGSWWCPAGVDRGRPRAGSATRQGPAAQGATADSRTEFPAARRSASYDRRGAAQYSASEGQRGRRAVGTSTISNPHRTRLPETFHLQPRRVEPFQPAGSRAYWYSSPLNLRSPSLQSDRATRPPDQAPTATEDPPSSSISSQNPLAGVLASHTTSAPPAALSEPPQDPLPRRTGRMGPFAAPNL